MDTLHGIRKEVLDFSRAAEVLLSPAALNGRLTADERDMVTMYAKNLLDEYGEQSNGSRTTLPITLTTKALPAEPPAHSPQGPQAPAER